MSDGGLPFEPPWRQRGLIRSLNDLSLRTSFAAICLPMGVVAVAYATGNALHASDPNPDPGVPLLSLALGTFVLVPMLALTGALTAIVLAISLLWLPGAGSLTRTMHALFVLAVGVWAVVTAAAYDWYVVPRLGS